MNLPRSYGLRLLDIVAIDPILLKEEKYNSLLLPTYKNFLLNDFDSEDLVVFAVLDPEPVSLIAVDIFPILQNGVLQSLVTLPDYRRKGYATALVKKIEERLERDEITLLTFNYPEEELNPKEVDPFCLTIGFSKAKPLVTRFFVDIQAFHPEWCDHPPPLPQGYEIVPFSLSKEEHEQMKIMVRQGAVSVEVNPLEDLPFEPINSLALRYDKKLVGWMVTKRLSQDCIGYTSYYIEREFRGLGIATTLLARSIQLQQASDVPLTIFEINNKIAPKSWAKFVIKRLEPFAYNKLFIYDRYKIYNYV